MRRRGTRAWHLIEARDNIRKMIARDEYSASFVTFAQDADCPTDPEAANNWVKDQIRLYVETWVLPHINEALEKTP